LLRARLLVTTLTKGLFCDIIKGQMNMSSLNHWVTGGMVKNRNEHKEPIIRVARCVIWGNSYMRLRSLPSGRLFAF